MTRDEPKHDRDWIVGCIKHDGFIKTDRGDKANQIILEALQAEPKHGEWEEEHLVKTMGGTYTVYRCSNCQRTVQPTAFNFCPNCGAKMDK